jgi:hypothetical protein
MDGDDPRLTRNASLSHAEWSSRRRRSARVTGMTVSHVTRPGPWRAAGEESPILPNRQGASAPVSVNLHLPPSAVSLVSDYRFRRSAQRLARLTWWVVPEQQDCARLSRIFASLAAQQAPVIARRAVARPACLCIAASGGEVSASVPVMVKRFGAHNRTTCKLEKACQGNTFAQRRDAAILAVFRATGIRLAELAGIRYHPDDPGRGDVDLQRREVYIRGKGGKDRVVRIDHEAARRVDRYLRVRARHPQAYRSRLWLGDGDRGPLTRDGIYQMVRRRGEQARVRVYPHRFWHHFSHTWLDRGGAEGDLMELNGWSSPQMLQRYGGSARGA